MKKKIVKKAPLLRQIFKEDIGTLMATQGPQQEAPMTDISLDQKVDHFLVQYERESVPMAAQYQESVIKPSLKNLMKFLFEAPEDDKPEDDETDPAVDPAGTDPAAGGADLGLGGGGGGGLGGGGSLGGDLGGRDPAAGGGGTGAPAIPTPKMNVSSYARSVARLINDYQSLIDPKRIILNRARAYLEKNYNPEIANQFLQILDAEFNISADSMGNKYNKIDSPIAAGAGDPIGQ